MTDVKKDRKLKKLTFRGKEIEELVTLKDQALWELFTSRARRRLNRSKGFKGKYLKLLEKVKRSKKGLEAGQKAKLIKTHLRNCIVTPEMVGGNIGVFSGKEYKEVEVKFDMIGTYLGEYSLTYKPTLRKAASIVDKGSKKKGGDDKKKEEKK